MSHMELHFAVRVHHRFSRYSSRVKRRATGWREQ